MSDRIAETLPTTLQLVGAALLFAVIFGLAAGLLAALRSGSKSETAVLTLTTVGIAVPNFWLGMMLVAFVAVKVEWLPTFGFVPISEGIRPYVLHLLLPALALSTVGIAEIARQSRSAMAEVLRSDHVRVARSKGLSPWQLLSRHVFKNAGIPILTVVGLLVNRLVGGTVVVESVFSITGSGSVVAHAAATRDVPMLQGLILALTIFVLLINLLVDTLYSKLDPRI